MGEILRVWIDLDACIHHGCCEEECPEVFSLPSKDDSRSEAFVRPGAEALFKSHADRIRKAVQACPVSAVVVEER